MNEPNQPSAKLGVRIAESLSDPSLTQFNLPVVQDNLGNTYEVVWMDPVHPRCRVITSAGVKAYLAKLQIAGNVLAVNQLKGALAIVVPAVVGPLRDWRRN